MKKRIAASLLSADFARLGEEAQAVLDAGADLLHFDVMDNHYVPNLTMGPMFCSALRKAGIKAPIDVHLMVAPVDSLVQAFVKAGASQISFHPDATQDIGKSLALIKDHSIQAGLAVNPGVSLDVIEPWLKDLDFLLIMTVNPGFAGQSFIPSVLDKIKAARQLIDQTHKNIRLAVDGGIGLSNIQSISLAGADTFVAGSAIFGEKLYEEVVQSMHSVINKNHALD